MIAETRGEVQTQIPPGFIELVTELAQRYGKDSVVPSPASVGGQMGRPSIEFAVPRDVMDDASIFAAELTVRIEDQCGKAYAVIVLSSDSVSR